MNLNIKQWFLNIVFFLIIIAGVILVFMDHTDSTIIISVMIGIPLTAYAGEMGVYSHHVSKQYKPKEK